MAPSLAEKAQWRDVRRQQSLANAERWLRLVENSRDPATLVVTEYENLLRALENAQADPARFDLAFRLVQALYPFIFGYGDWDRWLIYLQGTLKMSRQLSRAPEEARLLEQLGDLHYHKGNLTGAQTAYEAAQASFKHLEDMANFSSVLAKLAFVCDLQGESARGLALCQEALQIADAIDVNWARAHSSLNLSHILFRARDWEASIETAERARTLYLALKKPEYADKALMNMVAAWAEMGNWRAVDNYSGPLMATLAAAGDVRSLSQLKNNLGVAAFKQGNYREAEAAWQEALQLHSQLQEPAEVAHLYNNLGIVYTAIGEWAAAEEMLRQAIGTHEQLGDIYNWANSLDNLADLYMAQGQTADIESLLQPAVERLEAIDSNEHTQALLKVIQKRLESLR